MPLSFILLGVIFIYFTFCRPSKGKTIYLISLILVLISYFLPNATIGNILFNPTRLLAACFIGVMLSYNANIKQLIVMAGVVAISSILVVILISQNVYTSMDFPTIYMVLLTITCSLLPQNISYGTLLVASNVSLIILACYHNYNGLLIELMPEALILLQILALGVNAVISRFVLAKLRGKLYRRSTTV